MMISLLCIAIGSGVMRRMHIRDMDCIAFITGTGDESCKRNLCDLRCFGDCRLW